MIKYFIAYYAPTRAFCYDLKQNSFIPYYPTTNRTLYDYKTALHVLKRARKQNHALREYIHLDCMTV